MRMLDIRRHARLDAPISEPVRADDAGKPGNVSS